MSTGGEPAARRVLYVHAASDNPDNLTEKLIGEFDLTVEPNPEDALEQFETTDFDCIVCGYDLPTMTGVELVESIRQRDCTVPVILFTGEGTEAIASRAISAGVTDYIRREEGIESLVTRVQELTENRRQLSETGSAYERSQFERFLQAFPDAVLVLDESGRYLDYVTGGERSLLVDDADTLLGQRLHDVLDRETADRFLETINAALDTGEKQRIEYEIDVRKGRRWFEARVGPMETEQTQRTVFWIARDITERKRREQEYEQIFDGVNDAIAVFDPETEEIVTVNESYREMLGYDSLERLTELGIDGVSASEQGYTGERAWELIREVSETGEPETVEWQALTSTGEKLSVEATLALAEVGGKERVLSIQRDITERQEMEQTYREVFENVSDGLVVHDPDTGEILAVNQRYCELTGYDREELLDSTIRPIMPDDPTYTYEDVLERIRGAREEGAQLFEFKGQRKDGSVFLSEVNLRTVEIRGNERVLASVRDITERKRRKREYEQIFNNVNEIIAVRDPTTGKLLDVNQSYAELLGYEREEMRGMNIGDVGVPEEGYDNEEGMKHIRRVMDSDGPIEFEWKVRDSEGQDHLMEVRGTAAEINGEPRYLAIGRDITDRKRRERAVETLQAATERLQTATTPEEVASIAVETASEVLELPMAICWFHEETDRTLEPVAATDPVHEADLVSGLDATRYEYEVFTEGSVTEYRPSERNPSNPREVGVLLPLGDHGLIAIGTRNSTRLDDTVLDVAKAVSDHVATALDRVERAQAVRESERRFRMIAERIDEVIYLAEPDLSEVLYVNPAYEEIWDRPIETLEENPRAFIEAADHRDRETLEADIETMIAEIRSGDPDESYEFEYRIRQPDGELRWVNATGYTVKLPGEKRRFVGIVEDITDRKRREQRLEVFNRILRHNLRNQLDVIKSHAEVLTERGADDHAERIIDSVDELAEVGAEARETDRIMSMDTQMTDVSLSEIVAETIETTVQSTEIAVTTDLSASTLRTHEVAVRIAVESAIENALEHADSRISVTLEDEADRSIVTIEDDGPGIPEEQLTPIEAGTETNLRHARGLGLWLLRWSVDTLNGHLSFETTDGTTVEIVVPDQGSSDRRA